ncbi:FYVE, RhoGEF and PH domain-containing protein 6 [Anabrus simplex]|uniref:FYVE, RhoGEF and PH domain-containing protein 6 n=1 Tax=Anabrus simplex TaxID=316456 RepID=UPI0035A27042
MSLNRSDALRFSEIQCKHSSLRRSIVTRSVKQVIDSGDSVNTHTKNSPVPPPRRRRRSDPDPNQGHEVTVFHESRSIDSTNNLSDLVPIYAQVNYNLKKNRRVELNNSNPVDQTFHQEEKNDCEFESSSNDQEPSTNTIGFDINSCSEQSSGKVNFESNECEDLLHSSVHNCENKHIFESSKLNEGSALPLSNQRPEDDLNCCDNLVIKEDKCVDSASVYVSHGDKAEEYNSSVDNHMELKEVQDKCSDTCADCLPSHILELVCDDSLSSSKLDWQSARSSFHSCNDSTFSSGSSCSLIVSETVDDQFHGDTKDMQSKVDNPNSLNSGDEGSVNICYDDSLKSAGDVAEGVNLLKDNCNTISNTNFAEVNGNSYSDSQCKIAAREMCSSVENYNNNVEHTSCDSVASKSSRRCSRRWSWGCSNDFPDWLKVKLSGSVRFYERDFKRERSAVQDSVDTQRCSSVEEKKVKDGSGSHVGRKLLSWWGSFGKGHKKSGRSKRLSQFYCEQEAAQDFEDHSSAHYPRINVDSVPSPTEGLSSSAPVLQGVSVSQEGFSLVPKTPSSMCSDISIESANVEGKSEVMVSEGSFEINQHSDSEGEDIDSSFSIDVSKSLTADQHIEKKAFYIAKELMTSERVFIDVLKLLNVNFRQAVKNAGGDSVIPEVELCRIINSLPQLQRLNEDLLRDLEERIENWTSVRKIADVIVKKGPFLKLYTTYIQNFEAQCNYFDECCQKYPKFAKLVKDFEASPICQKLSIKHFMLKPVQRIPQYRLLLDDYSRNLDSSSPDYEDTQTALRIVSDVAEHANRSIKLGDHLSKLLQLQSRLGNYEIIKPGRMVLKEGELLKLSRKDRQPRYFILLNDCLLYTTYYGSGPSSSFKVNAELPLTGMKVTTPQAEDYHNEFSIISSTRSFTLSARSLDERQEWVDTLQKAINDHISRQLSFQNQRCNVKRTDGSTEFQLGREAPVWIQDGRVTKCQSCIAEFTVTFRRHHCRACGKVVCGDCSDFRAPLQYMKFQAARVCEECYKTLLKEFENADKYYEIIKLELGQCSQDTFFNIKSQFKRLGLGSGKKTRKYVPQRLLEVTANDTGSQISGWLQRRSKRSWKRLWFVLKDQVLYAYKASEDVVALETIPVLGYKIEQVTKKNFQLYEGVDPRCVFLLTHPGQLPLVFSADSENIARRWISTLQDATVLK